MKSSTPRSRGLETLRGSVNERPGSPGVRSRLEPSAAIKPCTGAGAQGDVLRAPALRSSSKTSTQAKPARREGGRRAATGSAGRAFWTVAAVRRDRGGGCIGARGANLRVVRADVRASLGLSSTFMKTMEIHCLRHGGPLERTAADARSKRLCSL